ncbi:MAG TPA: hypothetical protein DCP31_20835 [Cyanobacteria bacterium UBA8543]|nr:hypothetical protein [Cyanobacteria bacterium UBA8543]
MTDANPAIKDEVEALSQGRPTELEAGCISILQKDEVVQTSSSRTPSSEPDAHTTNLQQRDALLETPRSVPEAASNFVLRSGAIYIQDCVSSQLSNLYTLDLSTGKATLIGAIATEVYDIAFVGNQLYGLDKKDNGKTMQLLRIDPATGEATVIGDIGYFVAGLAYNRARNTLYGSTEKQLIAIDTKTGIVKSEVTVANQNYNCGEVAFDRNGKAYITLLNQHKKKILASCDLNTGNVTHIGETNPNLGSMDFYGDDLYGVTGNFFDSNSGGQLLRINTTTGAGTLITETNPKGSWGGISIYS